MRQWDALARLQQDHWRLLKHLETAESARFTANRDHWLAEYRDRLHRHFRAEEQILFPEATRAVLRRQERELFDRARKEHKELLLLLAPLPKAPDLVLWRPLVRRFTSTLSTHFQFEEDHLLPAVRRALGKKELLKLADALEPEE